MVRPSKLDFLPENKVELRVSIDDPVSNSPQLRPSEAYTDKNATDTPSGTFAADVEGGGRGVAGRVLPTATALQS